MATNRREIELLISARDTTGRTFSQVSSSIKNLATDIDKQAEAATRGEARLDELRKTQQELQQLGRDLSAIQGQIDGYRKLADNVSKSKDAHQAAVSALEAYRKATEGAEKLTAAQVRTLTGLEKKVDSTAQSYKNAQTNVESAAASLAKAGVEVQQLDAAQAQIIQSAQQTGAAFTTVGNAIDGFADHLRLAREAEQQLAQGNALDRKIAEATQLGEASRLVQLYSQAVDNAALSDQRLAALNGFRQVGAQAAEAAGDVARFNASAAQMTTSTSQIAAGLRNIINPGQEAITTLDGVEAKVAELGTILETNGETTGKYSVALNQLSEASAALLRQGALVDTFKNQEAAVARANVEFEQAQAKLRQVATAMQQADAPTKELTRDLDLAQTEFEQTGKALLAEETRLHQLSAALKTAQIDTSNLAAAEGRLTVAANAAAAATAKGNTRLGRGGEKPSGILGLNPYELQNLSFQLNDIFVGLSSGQKPLTVLIQQGSQIGQIFPGAIGIIGRFALAWGPVIVAVTAAGYAIFKTIDNINKLEAATAQVNLRGLTDFNPQSLVQAAELLEKAGLSAAEANKQIKAVLDTTSDETAFAAIIVNADAMAKKLGIDVPEAIKLQTDAFIGGIEATEQLAVSTNLLTDKEVAHAEELFKAGKAAEAHQYIQESLTAALQRQANLTAGVFTPAINNLKTAFTNFGHWLSSTFGPIIDALETQVKNVIATFTILTALLAGKSIGDAFADARTAIGAGPKSTGSGGNKFTAQDKRDADYQRRLGEEALQNRKDLTREQRLQIAGQKALNDAQAAGVSDSVAQLAVDQARRLERRKIADEDERAAKAEASHGRAAANRQAAAARRLQNQQGSAKNSIISQLTSLSGTAAKGSTADLAQRLDAINQKYEKIYETISKAKALGVTEIRGQSLAQLEASAKSMEEQVKFQETIKFFNEQINSLQGQRKDELDLINQAQQSGAISTKEAYQAALETQKRISPVIVANAEAALQIAIKAKNTLEQAGKAVPPELLGQIASLTNTAGSEIDNQAPTQVLRAGANEDQGRLDAALADRNALMQEYQTQLQLEIITEGEATAASKAGWEAAAPAIAAAAAKVRENLDLLHETRDELTGLPLISDTAYNAMLVKLGTVNDQLKFTDQNLLKIKQSGEQAFAQGFVDGIHSITDGIAGLITGTKSWGEALGGILKAGLSLVASFTKAIADAILQLIALKIAKQVIKAIGIFHGGGVVGGGSGTVRSGGSDIAWAAAPRFHSGTGMALAPDEYRAVLQRGEEVLTEDDPRHIRNWGRGAQSGAPAQSTKQVLLFDPEEIPRAMMTKSGEKATLSVIKAKAPTIKQMLGIK